MAAILCGVSTIMAAILCGPVYHHGRYSVWNCLPSWPLFCAELSTIMAAIQCGTVYHHGRYAVRCPMWNYSPHAMADSSARGTEPQKTEGVSLGEGSAAADSLPAPSGTQRGTAMEKDGTGTRNQRPPGAPVPQWADPPLGRGDGARGRRGE
ncbi:hypothetical protein ACOMHN_009538 [Nucella lapillus]